MFLRSREWLIESSGGKFNIATTPLDKARQYTEAEMKKAGRSLSELIPDFDRYYLMLQKRAKSAPDIPRIDMPVITKPDIKMFQRRLKKGLIDIKPPYAKGKLYVPTDLTKETGKQWLQLGWRDGDKKDDVIAADFKLIAVKNLKPTQSQIWLEKAVKWIAKEGIMDDNSSIASYPIIASKEGHILDGHHRYAQILLTNPNAKLKVLLVPVSIKKLLRVGRSYGNAIGNKQNF